MGTYTELKFKPKLKDETPKEVIKRFGESITQEELNNLINYGKTTLE